MRIKISIIILLSLLLLSLLVVSVAGAADGDKVVIKEMVQAPGGYSVGFYTFNRFDRMDDMYESLSRYLSLWFDRLTIS